MSLAYKVDELLALRDSVSESAVSIEQFPDEDVIRASAAANLTSRPSNRSLRVPTATAPTTFGPQKRPSPTPSFKRGKAEKLLKEHGSPPGLRVTAGGRIVPSDLPPLGTPRYGDTSYRSQQPLRVAPGNVIPMQAQSNGNSAARIEVVSGQPVIFVGDRMFALPAVDTASSTLPPSDTAAMNSTAKRIPDIQGALPVAAFGPSRSSTHTPFAGLDVTTLKTQQALKKQELRSVEQTEVLQSGHQSEAWRAGMIEKKRSLIVELDALRKQITALETDDTTAQPSSFPSAIGAPPGSIPSFGAQSQQSYVPTIYPFAATNPYAPMALYQPQPQPYCGFSNFATAEPAPFVPSSTKPIAPHSPPGSASRRSRAIEIKPPPLEETKKTSALNPKSPTYEPATKSGVIQGAVPPTPSPERPAPWHTQEMPGRGKHDRGTSSQKRSLSSVDTMDFFPTNTHEHSSTRVAPHNEENKQLVEKEAGPCTPEKHWPASPWNEGHSGRSRKNEPGPKLSSWPEAFGQQPSLSSLRQSSAGQGTFPMSERAPVTGPTMVTSASSSSAAPRTNSEQHTGADETWLFAGKPVVHVPSTYQEGYQAGYDHVGIPDSPEVLQGYIQGLLHFLTDESKKRQAEYQRGADSRTPSLRGLVAGSLPHDSAMSMGINRSSLNGGQENVRLAKATLTDEVRRDSGYGGQGNGQDASASYTTRNEVQQESRRVVSSAEYLNRAALLPQKMASGHRQVVFPSIEDDGSRGMKEKGIAPRAGSHSNGGAAQQLLGTQMQNHTHGTPLKMQGYYKTSKELTWTELGGYSAPSARPFANLRLSGLDGAMDDLSEMINGTTMDEGRTSVTVGNRPTEGSIPVEYEESKASCFKGYSGKGKQKATSSPAKTMDTEGGEAAASSPVNTSGSPKKWGEQSPAKAKLEQVTNKFRRSKKDDGRTMSPDERTRRSDKWRQRFQQLKRSEMEEIEAHRRNSRT
ncbi:DNA repair exonuclease [Stemphylium lycopersici]|nr:DNA repair exonuclease [Stemphylium lycopersici]